MNADTADLTELVRQVAALTEQAGALGRKVSALTGRVTIMGGHVARLDDILGDRLTGLTEIISVFLGAGPRHAPRHAAARDRRRSRPGWLRLADAGCGGAPGAPDVAAPGPAAGQGASHAAPALAIVRHPR